MTRIYKARYFPNDHVFLAKRGGGDSFIWSGIWKAKEKLKDGFRWVFGNGDDIRAFSDLWLWLKEGYHVDPSYRNANREEKVSDLFLPGTKSWDENKVRESFDQYDAQLILSTHILQNNVKDRVAWSNLTNGSIVLKWDTNTGKIVLLNVLDLRRRLVGTSCGKLGCLTKFRCFYRGFAGIIFQLENC